jgi:hypothetical protein
LAPGAVEGTLSEEIRGGGTSMFPGLGGFDLSLEGSTVRYDKAQFVKLAQAVHGDRYDYSQVVYRDSQTQVTILCLEHGVFQQRPDEHLQNHGCPRCGVETRAGARRMSLTDFVARAKEFHGEAYDYRHAKYVNCDAPITIICPRHGAFEQTPYSHLVGSGCRLCAYDEQTRSRRLTTQEFIEKARQVHSDNYDYASTAYVDGKTPVAIVCRTHGTFLQIASSHLAGRGCPACGKERRVRRRTGSTAPFISKARAVHGDRYDYSRVEYAGSKSPVEIVCREHGAFRQAPNNHLNGSGCPYCAGKRVHAGNCLAVVNPDLASEWHPARNGVRTPRDVSASSHYQAWWRCPSGHEWQATINSRRAREGRDTGCPFCKLSDVADCLAVTHPVLSQEWHPERNWYWTPRNLTADNHQAFWWRCRCGNEYEMVVSLRALLGLGCPRCSRITTLPPVTLATLYPEVAAEWHPTRNGGVTPDHVHPGQSDKRWWLGACGHEWEAVVSNRTHNRSSCPYCSNRIVDETNSLEALRPDVAAEWHSTANGEQTPRDVLAGSHTLVYWQCRTNPEHEWAATVKNRTLNGSGCPKCKASRGQRLLCEIVKRIFPGQRIEFDYRHPDLRFSKSNRMMELDIYLPDRNLAFEYQGEWHFDVSCFLWHNGIEWCMQKNQENWARDEEKRQACRRVGITLIEIDYRWDGSEERVRAAIAGDFTPFRPRLEVVEGGYHIHM